MQHVQHEPVTGCRPSSKPQPTSVTQITETVLGVSPLKPNRLYEFRQRSDGVVELVRIDYAAERGQNYWERLGPL